MPYPKKSLNHETLIQCLWQPHPANPELLVFRGFDKKELMWDDLFAHETSNVVMALAMQEMIVQGDALNKNYNMTLKKWVIDREDAEDAFNDANSILVYAEISAERTQELIEGDLYASVYYTFRYEDDTDDVLNGDDNDMQVKTTSTGFVTPGTDGLPDTTIFSNDIEEFSDLLYECKSSVPVPGDRWWTQSRFNELSLVAEPTTKAGA